MGVYVSGFENCLIATNLFDKYGIVLQMRTSVAPIFEIKFIFFILIKIVYFD